MYIINQNSKISEYTIFLICIDKLIHILRLVSRFIT